MAPHPVRPSCGPLATRCDGHHTVTPAVARMEAKRLWDLARQRPTWLASLPVRWPARVIGGIPA